MRRVSFMASIVLALVVLLPATASAQTTNCTTQTLNPFTYTDCNGANGSVHCTTQTLDPFTYTDCNQTGTRAPTYVAPTYVAPSDSPPMPDNTCDWWLRFAYWQAGHGQAYQDSFNQWKSCSALVVAAPPPPPADQGITINMGDGTQKYLARGTFVKIGDAPAIYWVYGAQFHAFSTWPQFLNAGGNPDFSNVVRFSSMQDGGSLYGSPVQ